VLETESVESWTWFLQNLWYVIGFPDGLAIHTDACKGLEIAVEDVFSGVEHWECMRHVAAHFKLQDDKGQLFDDNLWPASLTCSLKMYNYHMDQMYTNPRVKTYMENHHKKVWARSKFNEACKLDYVNNNLAECLNSWIRKIKGLHLVDMLDKIRQILMVKFELRQRIASQKLVVTCCRNFKF
jgi:transposase-like protein